MVIPRPWLWLGLAACCLTVLAVGSEATWGHHPAPIIPADNPLTKAKIALGQQLFHDAGLSANGTTSCATCHQPERHFTDGLPRAIGADGKPHRHNTPTLYNTAYNASYGWRDDGVLSLENQHRVPLFNTDPVEMGYSEANLTALTEDPAYVQAFTKVFGGRPNTDNIIQAIASYVRTLTPPETAFDRYFFYDEPMTDAARAGLTLFFSERLGCASCHAGFTLSGPIRHQNQAAEPVFHVTGVAGSTEAFRAPTLRQIQNTAPFMHNGSLADLDAVITHYETTTAERVPDFSLTAEERQALIAFLRAL